MSIIFSKIYMEEIYFMKSLLKYLIILALIGSLQPSADAKNISPKANIFIEQGVYSKTVKVWRRVVEKLSFKSNSWVLSLGSKDRLHKNGRRDSVLIVPDHSASEKITLIVWFHGLGGFSEKGFESRIAPQLELLVKNNHSFALAIPEMPWSINTSTPRGRQGRVWMSPGELEKYVGGLKEHLEIWALLSHQVELKSIDLIFIGHSAGGSTIMSASKEGGLCRLKPKAVIFSDASYGRWLDYAWHGCIKGMDKNSRLYVLVRKWDSPHKNAERAMKLILNNRKNGPEVIYRVLNRRVWTHRKIGNSVFEITKEPLL